MDGLRSVGRWLLVLTAIVVFLHGGTGVADMATGSAYFGQLARDGFDVWVYGPVGRDAADLEVIRQRIGAERLILIGQSYGGTLAAAI